MGRMEKTEHMQRMGQTEQMERMQHVEKMGFSKKWGLVYEWS